MKRRPLEAFATTELLAELRKRGIDVLGPAPELRPLPPIKADATGAYVRVPVDEEIVASAAALFDGVLKLANHPRVREIVRGRRRK